MESQVERTLVVDNEGQPVMMMQRISVAAAENEDQAASGPAERRTLHQLNVLVLPEQLRRALRPSTVSVVSEPSHDGDEDDDDCDCTCGCICVLRYIIIILLILLLLPFLPFICLCICCYHCCCKDD